jgi:hypothetical protein
MQGVMTHAVELRRWLDLWDEQQQMIQANIDRGNRAEEQLAERAELRRQLLVSEQSLARAVAERAEALEAVEHCVREMHELDQSYRRSTSWQLTRPIRRASELLHRLQKSS